MSDLVFYRFSRASVETLNFSDFLTQCSPGTFPVGRELAARMDTLICTIDGYETHPDELHSIPEVRRFYSAFRRVWPYWLYFCNLDDDTLKVMVFSCLETLSTAKVAGQTRCVVELDPRELVYFIKSGFPPMNALCLRAGLSELAIYGRTKDVLEYFDIPFDAPPPS